MPEYGFDEIVENYAGPALPIDRVRSRGVMEKCSYCVQRINAAKSQVEKPQS